MDLDDWIEALLKCIGNSQLIDLKQNNNENDSDLIALYNHLVEMDPCRVDTLLTKLGGLPDPLFTTNDIYGNDFFHI